jgi:hypothetical protein
VRQVLLRLSEELLPVVGALGWNEDVSHGRIVTDSQLCGHPPGALQTLFRTPASSRHSALLFRADGRRVGVGVQRADALVRGTAIDPR